MMKMASRLVGPPARRIPARIPTRSSGPRLARRTLATDSKHPLERIDPSESPTTYPLKGRSHELTGNPTVPDGAPGSFAKMTCARSNFRAVGWRDADFRKPIITVGVPYTNIMPCNNKL